MNYNFHTHTYRCNHATGAEREYIEAAVEAGIKELGFSDHIPFIFPNGKENSYRVPMREAQEYIDSINALKEEYKDKINIHVGFEMEYYEEYFEAMLDNARKWGAEYLILGQHSVGAEPEFFFWCTEKTENLEYLKEYVDRVVAAIMSGVFTYVAHPDIMNFVGDIDIYNKEMRKICEASKKYSVPLEINFLGIRDARCYPTEKFWAIAGEVGSPVVFGFDAHDAEAAGDLDSLPIAMKICQKYNLNVLKRPELINI